MRQGLNIIADNVIIDTYNQSNGIIGIIESEAGDIYWTEICPEDAEDVIGTVVASEYLHNLNELSDRDRKNILAKIYQEEYYGKYAAQSFGAIKFNLIETQQKQGNDYFVFYNEDTQCYYLCQMLDGNIDEQELQNRCVYENNGFQFLLVLPPADNQTIIKGYLDAKK